MGVTYNGLYEPVKAISEKLDEIQAATGLDVKIHVDGASGGMIAPFCQPDLEWDFRVPRVVSINTSGHKYGLVYPGLGWIVWRDTAALPRAWCSTAATSAATCPPLRSTSRGLARRCCCSTTTFCGWAAKATSIQQASLDVAVYLSSSIAEMGPFELVSKGRHHPGVRVASQARIHRQLDLVRPVGPTPHEGLAGPGLPMADDLPDMTLQRMVVRTGLSHDLATALLRDIDSKVAFLDALDGPMPREGTGSHFHH